MKKIFHLLSLCFCALALIGCENKQSNSTIENIETGYLELNKYSIFVDDLSWKNSFIVAGFDNQDIEEIIIPMDGHSDELNEWAGFKENAQNENRAFLQYLDCSGSGFAPRCECVTGFNNCPNLKRVIFKSYVDFIQPSSGTNSALDSEYHDRGAKLANKVNIENAFNNCPNLSEIIFENLDVSTIGNKNNLYPRSSNEYQETDERIQIDSSKFAFSFGKCFQNASFKHLELPFYVHISQDISFKTRNIKVDGLSKEENESIRQDDFYSCLAFNNSGVQTLIASAPSQTRIINTNLSTIEHYSQKQFAINQDDDLFDKDEQNSFFHFNGNMPNLKTFSTLYLGLNELVLNNNGKYISESRNNNAITIFGLANASINIEKVDIKDLYFTGTGVSHHFENCFNNSNYIDGLIESGVEERNVFRVYKNCFNYNVCPENLLISNKEIRLENCFNNINSVFISLNPSIQVTESFKNINSLCKYSGQWGDDLLTNSTANVEEIEIIQSSTLANESFNVKKLIIDGGVLKANSGVLLDKVEELVIKNDGIVNDVSFNGQIKMLPNVKYLSFVDCNYITGNWSEHQNLETILFKANENGAVVENLYFGGCTALKRINLIGNFVHGRYGGFYFRNCTELEEVTLEGSIDKLINSS